MYIWEMYEESVLYNTIALFFRYGAMEGCACFLDKMALVMPVLDM